MRRVNERRAQRAVIALLESLGYEDWETDQNLKDTPSRVVRMFKEMCVFDEEYVEDIFKAVFPSPNNQMMILRGINAAGVCPHHLMPIHYKAAIAYVPKDKVLGLSKIARLVEAYGRQLVLQEDLTGLIANALQEKLEPRGVMVVLEGNHGCMTYRGVKQHDAVTVTSAVTGVFRDPAEKARDEFLALVNRNGV